MGAMNLAPVTAQSGTRKKKKRGKRIGFAREHALHQMDTQALEDAKAANDAAALKKQEAAAKAAAAVANSSGSGGSGGGGSGGSGGGGGSMLAGLNIRNKKSAPPTAADNAGPTPTAEQKFQDDLAKAMAASMQGSTTSTPTLTTDATSTNDSSSGLDLSSMDSLPQLQASTSTTSSSTTSTITSNTTTSNTTTSNTTSNTTSASNARRPSYTAAHRSSRSNTLEGDGGSGGSGSPQRSTTERMAQEAKVFEQTAKAFQTQVIEFSEKKIALGQEKVELEAQTLVLTEQLTAKEMTQNNAIENEDYEVAESLNEAIANLQTQQSRNASQLRNVGESIDRLRYLPPFLWVFFFLSRNILVPFLIAFLLISSLSLFLTRGICSETKHCSCFKHT